MTSFHLTRKLGSLMLLLASGPLTMTAQSAPGASPARRGFYLQKTILAQMDTDPQLEEVQMWGTDNGHWPEFDLFRVYYSIVDAYTGELEYTSPAVYLTDQYDMAVEDKNADGISELYFSFIRNGSFRTDERGYYKNTRPMANKVEWKDGAFSDTADPQEAGTDQDARSIRNARSTDSRIVTPPASARRTGKEIRVIMIAGQDGSHWWRGACEAMKQILENSGLFAVDFCFTPDWNGDMNEFMPDFSRYDLAVINYGGNDWPETVQRDFEKFVADGGGAVFLHSCLVPHEKWQGWCDMTGLGAWNGRDEKWGPRVYMVDGKTVYDYTPGYAGYHGLQHETIVENVPSGHPITRGLPAKWRHYKDEIYLELRGPAKNLEILATTHDRDKDFPVMWTVRYGKGRVFVDVQGHCGNDPEMIYSMTCTGFQTTFLRGCEWAARGTVTQGVPSDFPTEKTLSVRPDFKMPETATWVSEK